MPCHFLFMAFLKKASLVQAKGKGFALVRETRDTFFYEILLGMTLLKVISLL